MLACTRLKSGPGIPIVFLHGFLGTGEDWKSVCSFLPPSSCIAFDLPGHGKSPFVETFDLPIDAERFHLVGYSMGGRLALEYAAQNRERIASLTLASTHPGLTSETERKNKLENDSKWAKLLFELPIDEFLSRWYDQPLFHPFKPDLSMRRRQNIPALAAALLHYSLGKRPLYRFEEALILIGENDQKFRSLYQNPILIPNAGHAIHLQNPKAVAQEIERRIFL